MIHIKNLLIIIGISLISQSIAFSKFIRGKRFKKVDHLLTSIPEQYYDQRLDHFNEAETGTWKQRYWVNERYFDGTGPVFIMIGGEGEENPVWMENGQWINFAMQYV